MIRLFLAIAALIAFSGCSTFDREWRRAPAAGRDPLAGRWDGEWRSTKHAGARGRLRSVIKRTDAKTYQARFHANWLVFASAYTLLLQTTPVSTGVRFQGKHDLGFLYGGMYTCEGTTRGGNFRATYRSAYDEGTFTMQSAKR